MIRVGPVQEWYNNDSEGGKCHDIDRWGDRLFYGPGNMYEISQNGKRLVYQMKRLDEENANQFAEQIVSQKDRTVEEVVLSNTLLRKGGLPIVLSVLEALKQLEFCGVIFDNSTITDLLETDWPETLETAVFDNVGWELSDASSSSDFIPSPSIIFVDLFLKKSGSVKDWRFPNNSANKSWVFDLIRYMFDYKIAITKLDISGCRLGNALQTTGWTNATTLTLLNFSDNNLTLAKVTALLSGLKPLTALTSIDLSDNVLGDGIAKQVSKFLLTNPLVDSVYLNNVGLSEIGLVEFQKFFVSAENAILHELKRFHIARNRLGGKSFEIIEKFIKCITDINLSNVGMDDTGLEHILEGIKFLPITINLNSNNFTDEGIESVRQRVEASPRLESISLENIHGISEKTIRHLYRSVISPIPLTGPIKRRQLRNFNLTYTGPNNDASRSNRGDIQAHVKTRYPYDNRSKIQRIRAVCSNCNIGIPFGSVPDHYDPEIHALVCSEVCAREKPKRN